MFTKKNKLVIPGEKKEFKKTTYVKKEVAPYDTKRLWEYSIWLISKRDYSEQEILKKLKAKQPDPEIYEPVLNKLIDSKYINDERRANSIVSAYMNSESTNKIKQRLIMKGIDKETIQNTLDDNISDEKQLETALQLLIKKFKIYDKEYKQKYSQHLASRGFSWDNISKAINNFKDYEDLE